MRGEYLFPLAHLCSTGPREADALRISDFAALTDGIDVYLKARKEAGQ